jgi:hypothetical protein
MSETQRTLLLYELSQAQNNFEEQISSELATRGGLLAALAGLIAVGLTELWRYQGRSHWHEFSCALLIVGIVFLFAASIGMTYERPDSVGVWEAWAKKEQSDSAFPDQVDSDLVSFLKDRYADCVRTGMTANDSKASRLNWASAFIIASLLSLLFALLIG